MSGTVFMQTATDLTLIVSETILQSGNTVINAKMKTNPR